MSAREFTIPRGDVAQLGFSATGLDRLAGALRREIEQRTFPGAVLLVGRDGRIAIDLALGVQDEKTGAPMRPDSLFRIYSMTKAITSTLALMLMEDGRLQLDDPVSKYIPAFASPKVATFDDGSLVAVGSDRQISIHSLFLHTSGLSHEMLETPVQSIYARAQLARRDRTNEELAEAIAALPLLCTPGTQWNYSRSIEVLGRVIEVITGQTLGDAMRDRIFDPLGMTDTGFHAVPSDAEDRLAEPFAVDPWTDRPVSLFDMRQKPAFEAGGGGLVSTAPDYARFAQMILNGGELNGTRILGSRTVRFMLSDHLSPEITHRPEPLPPGYGFGLGFAIRTEAGLSPNPGSVGQFFWNGVAGTQFWGDPLEGLWAILMVQAPGQREYIRSLIRNLVYGALEDRPAG